jgi:hypothetical protein
MPVNDVDKDLEVVPTIAVAEPTGIREITVCPGCGRTASTWAEPLEARDGQTYCCGDSANEEQCVCGARLPN